MKCYDIKIIIIKFHDNNNTNNKNAVHDCGNECNKN